MAALTIDQALQYAAERHAAGFLSEAEGIYRQVLALQPENVEAKHLLGRIAVDTRKLPEAAQLLGEALRAAPSDPRYQVSWSLLLRAQGDLAGAVAAARQAVELAPAYAPARLHLALVLDEQDDVIGAEAAYRAALAVAPGLAEAHNDLGILLDKMGRKDEAIAELRRAVQLRADYVDARCNLGLLLGARGDHDEAVSTFEDVLRVRPDFARGHRVLGVSLRYLGRHREAIRALSRAVQLQPRDALAQNELGVALWQNREPDPAIASWRAAIQIDRGLTSAYHHLGVAYLAGNEVEEAVACYRTLVDLEPENPWHHNNLGAALNATGNLDAGIAALRKAMELAPSESRIHSGLVCALQFHPRYDAPMLLEAARSWDRIHGGISGSPLPSLVNSPEPERRLRIGYTSPNFWAHVVGRNILPLFQHHDHEKFEVFCYADLRVADEMTGEFARCADQWRNTLNIPDETLAAIIRADGIDILVDLNLHLAHDRLPVFARRAAPVQVAFAGYPGTTGLRTMDYRLTDPYLDPPGEADGYYSEQSIRLPQSFWCYVPQDLVPVNDLPAAQTGVVTFGCLNNFFKINEPALELWGQILQAVPRSRLLVQAAVGTAQKRVVDVLGRQGIESERLAFVPKGSHRDYLEFYHRFDIMLDSFPYNGHTTSLDALWMGVPVITLAGKHAVARAGVSQLTNIGLLDLIADSEATYVEKAVRLAGDLEHLRDLRQALRGRMEASPLMDPVGFTRGIEAAYRTMWQRWCQDGALKPPRP